MAVAEARAAELVAAGLPAEVDAGTAPFARATGWLLRVGLLAALLWGIGFLVADGVEPYVSSAPNALTVFGLVLPTFAASVVAGIALPAWLCLATIGGLRRRSAQVQQHEAEALAAQLAARDVAGRAAEVDARARALARRVVEADLSDVVEQDLLLALDACRSALRRGGAGGPEAVLEAADQELARLEAGLHDHRVKDLLADDASSPLAGLRAAAAALPRAQG